MMSIIIRRCSVIRTPRSVNSFMREERVTSGWFDARPNCDSVATIALLRVFKSPPDIIAADRVA